MLTLLYKRKKKKKKIDGLAGNRTPISRVTVGYTKPLYYQFSLNDHQGFEPLTFGLQVQRSTL